jgi:hypothetical protein
MALERTDIDWAREIADHKATAPTRTQSFAQGHQSGSFTATAAKGQGAAPAQTVVPQRPKSKFGFLKK